ncbi:MAG: endonuclease/exonuclease/phosphatase family protein [Gemmataceae bacterium]
MPRPLLLLALLSFLPAPAAAQVKLGPKTVQFCFWNVENLFDDRPNPKLDDPDRSFDKYFSGDGEALQIKLDRLVEVLLGKEYHGKGPDVLCMAEVESKRAVELVQRELNRKLKDKGNHYNHVVYLDPEGGRSIATAVLSRVPVVGKPALLSSQRRILKVTLEANKHQLTVVASHWTSRVSDKTGNGRRSYAEAIHRDYAGMVAKDPKVAYLVCGDFNDGPDEPAVVKSLNATGELKAVLDWNKGDRPVLYNPFADLAKAKKGTHFFGPTSVPYVFDQIVMSPAMLEPGGWEYKNKSATIVEKFAFHHRASNTYRPDRFGGADDRRPYRNRGASDHYPVVVELKVP